MQATATTLDHEQEYTPINSRNKVLVASLIGTAIEFFDFYIYATAAVIVFPHIFFPQGDPTAATLQSLATFAIAFVARPIGSAVFGHFGDRVGRKATLVASLLTMGISTVVIGLLPGYATIGIFAPLLLALARFGQGLGLGGEWGGAALLALLEWSNPRTMGGLSVPGKIMAALFQSVSTRTAGMNTIDLAACSPISKLLMSMLQFIGAAPGSTGGGVKVTTFAVLILTIRSVAQGRDDCVIGGHHIESKTVYRALTIIVIGAVAAFGSAVVVYYNTAETVSVIDCIFESCSAFGTVGLSVGVTGQLNTGAKLLYMACMFMGRVGPVSLAISLTAKPDDNKRKVLPVGHINVG